MFVLPAKGQKSSELRQLCRALKKTDCNAPASGVAWSTAFRISQLMEADPADAIRTPAEVARRALVLFGVVAVAFGADREEILVWLSDCGLSDLLSPTKRRFLDNPAPSEREIVHASWYSERLIILLWALKVAPMPPRSEQCDAGLLQKLLPPYAEISEADFISLADLRPARELIDARDTILQAHWAARDAKLHGREPPQDVDLEIIQEHHHAINWVIGYDGLSWDEVTADT